MKHDLHLAASFIRFICIAGCVGTSATPTPLPTHSPSRVPLSRPSDTLTAVVPTETPTRRPTRDPNAAQTPELVSEVIVTTSDLAASHNGKWIAWTDRRVVLVEDVENLYVAGTFAMPEDITAIVFHPNAKSLALGFENGIVREIDAATGGFCSNGAWNSNKSRRIVSLAYNADGTMLAAGAEEYYQGGQGSVSIWTAGSATATHALPSYGAVTRVLFAPNSDTLYFSAAMNSCSRGGGGIFAWEGVGSEAREVFSGHGNAVLDFAIHPQATLASVGKPRAAGVQGARSCRSLTRQQGLIVTWLRPRTRRAWTRTYCSTRRARH